MEDQKINRSTNSIDLTTKFLRENSGSIFDMQESPMKTERVKSSNSAVSMNTGKRTSKTIKRLRSTQNIRVKQDY